MKKITVKKIDLLRKMSNKTGLTQLQCEKAMLSLFVSIEETLSEGNKIVISNFGTFDTRLSAARIINNPNGKGKFDVPEKLIPLFTFSNALKKTVMIAGESILENSKDGEE